MKHLKIVFMGGHHHTNVYSNKMISTAPPDGQRGTNITAHVAKTTVPLSAETLAAPPSRRSL